MTTKNPSKSLAAEPLPEPITPIIGPLLALLRSRKFLVALATLIINVVIAYVPELEAVQTELLTIFTLIGSVLVGAIAYEDGQKQAHQ
ncbi:MAG: hypothetical protein GYB68_08880 [Chloroflexi bacterium]|nr:hypothetical protein [Chloroflexota bacterium]